jgi:hypothetical protein
MNFGNLTNDKRQEILDYELSVYVCEGSDSEKLDWFKIINIAGMKLTDQELRNAIYTGPWLADAKRWFSKTGAPAVQDGRDKLVNGSPIRQEVLETALDWQSGAKNRELHGRAPAPQGCPGAMAVLASGFRLGQACVSESRQSTRQADEGLAVGRVLQQTQGRQAECGGTGEAYHQTY